MDYVSSLFRESIPRRSLNSREKEWLWEHAKRRCEACGRKLDFKEMQIGHKTAYARGGATKLTNSVCLCPNDNRRQRIMPFKKFLRVWYSERYEKTKGITASDALKRKKSAKQIQKKRKRRRSESVFWPY
jgi:5-methylcytosine-specific restriction endonuclease McrA